ncbi:MAG: prolyl oligopeptidase family serine peptidase [Pseudohongiella sp.]|nr:prolyl oligopeptidase family serine peptidase [Pseudohongiella sp.]
MKALYLSAAVLTHLLMSQALAQTSNNSPGSMQDVDVRQVGSARLENVPAIPEDVRAAVQRYQNFRSAQFQDWLPDGSMLITTRFGSTSQLHRVRTPGGNRQQLTFYDEPIAGAQSIPGTERFLFSRDTGGDEWFQLFTRGLDGNTVQLTDTGTRNQSARFSDDGQLLAWSRALSGSGDYAIFTANPAEPDSTRLLWQGIGSVGPADISDDGRTILVNRSLSNQIDELMLLNAESAELRPLNIAGGAARYDSARFIKGGEVILTISNNGSDVRRLVEIDVASGTVTPVSPELPWDVETYALSKDGQILAYAVNEDGFSRVVVQNRVSGNTQPQPDLPRGVLTALDFSTDGSTLAIGLSTARSAGDVWSHDVVSGELTRWTESELGDLDASRLAEPTLVRFDSFDGLSVPAFLYRSTRAAPDAKLPVIIDIHGGPESQSRPGWNPGAQYFADTLNAVVILPNVRGSDGYGTRYLNLDNAEKREDSVKDIGALLDWITTQPGLDAERVAVYGQSYGGYMSLAAMIHYSDRLVGGVERYGISNWISFLQNTEAYRRDNRRAEYGDERDPAMRAVFERISPLNNVSRITRPMLVMQGANDPRVPQSESDQVVRELRANGVDTSYVLFADEGHGFLKKANNDLRREVETVFLRRLFGVE